MEEIPAENQPNPRPAISITFSGDQPAVRRLRSSGAESGDLTKMMRRRRRRSTDNPREVVLLREEKLAKQKLTVDFSKLTSKVQKLKTLLAKRGISSSDHNGGQNPTRHSWRNTRGKQVADEWDEALDSASRFFLVSLTVLLALWLAVNVSRGVAVYLLPELFLECAILPSRTNDGIVGDIGTVSDWRERTALAWQLLFGHHPCQPVYLHPQCEGESWV